MLTTTSRGGTQAAEVAPGRHRVLVVDDEERIRLLLVRILHGRGLAADATSDGAVALAMADACPYDLVILDLLLPGADGFEVLKELVRRRPNQAIMVLSCLSDAESKIAGLGLGADDYVPKPFHVGELVARVQARLRAGQRQGGAVITVGRLRLDLLRREADTGSGPVSLTRREFELLWELAREPGAVLSKEALLGRVWGSAPEFASNVVDVYVRRLRARLGPAVVTTVRSEGYRVGPG